MNNIEKLREQCKYLLPRDLYFLKNPKAILCVDSALHQNDLTSVNDTSVCRFGNVSKPIFSQYECVYPNKFGDKDIIRVNGMLTTNKERTIMECLYWDIQIDLIIEAIADYLDFFNGDLDVLREKAKEYGVLKEFEDTIQYLDEYYES